MFFAVTPGEPAGIGPELVCRLISESDHALPIIAFANKRLLEQTADQLCLKIDVRAFHETAAPLKNTLWVHDVPLPSPVKPGELNTSNASYVLQTLELATAACLEGKCAALVTGPVQKSVINDAGIAFTGHTEWLCERAGCSHVVMMLATTGLRVTLATTHLPLSQVPKAITDASLKQTLRTVHTDLIAKFGIQQPQILVCGLNPHAGEGGHMGREEIDVISPALEDLRREGLNLTGPLPADTLFTPRHLEKADAVLAMYHDQGLPVLKYKGFGEAVNITLGLPFIRTSVDHGTALDLAGKGLADLGSLRTAVEYAQTMINAQHQ